MTSCGWKTCTGARRRHACIEVSGQRCDARSTPLHLLRARSFAHKLWRRGTSPALHRPGIVASMSTHPAEALVTRRSRREARKRRGDCKRPDDAHARWLAHAHYNCAASAAESGMTNAALPWIPTDDRRVVGDLPCRLIAVHHTTGNLSRRLVPDVDGPA